MSVRWRMTISILPPLLVCILGMLCYALAANPKVQELGRHAYWTGLLVSLYVVATRVVTF